MPTAKPIDVYVRVSRVGGREHLTSPDDQKRDAERFAATRGLTIGETVEDIDKSGGNLDRAGLQRVLERVESGKSGGVVVAYLSRLTRDTSQGLGLLDRIRLAGGVVYAPNLPADYTTADGRMLTTIQLAVDAGYRERKAEEFERAKEAAIANGIPVITRAAVGYRQRDDRRLEPDPATAPIVRQAFELRAAGAGPTAIAALLEREGVQTSQGSRTWSKQGVYNLLSNRTYLGELSYGRDARFVNAESHEPIVDLALWLAAQHPNGRRVGPVAERSAWLLTGLLRCSACRYCLQGTTTSRGKRIYRCTRRHSGGICPSPARIDAETAEALAVDTFWRITDDIEARGTAIVDNADRLDDLQADLDRAEQALRDYMAPDVQEAIGDAALWSTGLRERRETRDRIAGELGTLRAARAPEEFPAADTLRAAWERMTTRDRRELLSLRFDALALSRDPRQLVAYPAGTGPKDLPRRGFKSAPVLAPFPPAPKSAPIVNV